MTEPMIQARDGRAVRLGQFWVDMQARLSTPETLGILRDGRPASAVPNARVYRATEDFSEDAGPSTARWGRQVIIPAETLWPGAEVDSWYRGAGWLVRSEMNDFTGAGYDPTIPLERLQQIAYEQLNGWAPTPGPTTDYMVTRPIWRQRPPQPMPEWDGDRELWWMSSEFRGELTRRI